MGATHPYTSCGVWSHKQKSAHIPSGQPSALSQSEVLHKTPSRPRNGTRTASQGLWKTQNRNQNTTWERCRKCLKCQPCAAAECPPSKLRCRLSPQGPAACPRRSSEPTEPTCVPELPSSLPSRTGSPPFQPRPSAPQPACFRGGYSKRQGRLLAQSHMPLSSVWATCPCPVLSCIFWGPPQRPPKGPLLPTPRGVFHVQVKILDQFMALVWGEDRPRRLRRWFRVLSTAPGSDLSPLPTSLFCPV